MINTYLDLELFTFGNVVITLGMLLGTVLLTTVSFFVYKKVIKVYLPKFYKFFNISNDESSDLKKLIRNVILLVVAQVLITMMNWDTVFYTHNSFYISIGLILKVLMVFQISKLLIWGVDNIIHSFYLNRQPSSKEESDDDEKKELSIISSIRSIIYLSASVSVVKFSNLNFEAVFGDGSFTISIVKVLSAILIIFVARVIVWILTHFILARVYTSKKMPFAQQFAINQLILYVVYVLAIFIALNFLLGSKMTVIYGGAAALLVGVGLGLQQTFNDFFSGLVLLFERSVGVGDIIELEQKVGKVMKIGLRSSLIQTRDSTTIIVPNSKMVNFNIQNISHEIPVTRFDVLVSVAYGSDTALVERLLLQSLSEVQKVLNSPSSSVQFIDFGADGLSFRLLFYTRDLFGVENTKSKIRFNIDKLFREHDITVPFPQRTVWIKGDDTK